MIKFSRPLIFLLIIVLALLCYFVPFKPISILAALLLAIIAIWLIAEKKYPGFSNKVFKNFTKTTLTLNNNTFELSTPTADVIVKRATDEPFALLDGEEIPLTEDISIERDSKNLKYITLYLPRELDKIKLSLVAGDLDLSLASARLIEAQSVSGNVKLLDIAANEITTKSVSGDVSLYNASCDKLTAYSTSGDCEIKRSKAQSIKAGSISGDIELLSDFNSCDLSTTSGDIDITTEDKGFSLTLQSTTGDSTVFGRSGKGQYKEDGREGYSIKASSLSGSINVIRR